MSANERNIKHRILRYCRPPLPLVKCGNHLFEPYSERLLTTKDAKDTRRRTGNWGCGATRNECGLRSHSLLFFALFFVVDGSISPGSWRSRWKERGLRMAFPAWERSRPGVPR